MKKTWAVIFFVAAVMVFPVSSLLAGQGSTPARSKGSAPAYKYSFNSSRLMIKSKFSQPEETTGPKAYYPTKARIGTGAKKSAATAKKKPKAAVKK